MASLSTSRKPEPGAFRERRAVIVVDPLPVVRAGLSMLLASRPGFEVVAGVGTAADALAALDGVPSACVLVGLGLEGPNDAYWLTETIRDRFPNATVIALGSRSDTMTISRALLSGAGAFVDKTVEPDEFLDSMDLAVAGEMVLAGPPSEWVGAIAGALDQGNRPGRPAHVPRASGAVGRVGGPHLSPDRRPPRRARTHGDDPPQQDLREARRPVSGRGAARRHHGRSDLRSRSRVTQPDPERRNTAPVSSS